MLSLKKEITEERNKKIRSILETCLKREAKEEVLLPNVNLYLVCFGNLHFRREVEAEGEHPVPELGLPEEFLVLPYRESNLRILAGFGENGGEETAGRIFGMLKQEYPPKKPSIWSGVSMAFAVLRFLNRQTGFTVFYMITCL